VLVGLCCGVSEGLAGENEQPTRLKAGAATKENEPTSLRARGSSLGVAKGLVVVLWLKGGRGEGETNPRASVLVGRRSGINGGLG
jgi:hypothetical protein